MITNTTTLPQPQPTSNITSESGDMKENKNRANIYVLHEA
jgi:hypothetical protein